MPRDLSEPVDTPSDDELRAWRKQSLPLPIGDDLRSVANQRVVVLCDALLVERRAHSETRARLDAITKAVRVAHTQAARGGSLAARQTLLDALAALADTGDQTP